MDTVFDVKSKTQVQLNAHKWMRSEDGVIAGVCEGLGQGFDISPNVLRIGWVISILFFGTGIFAYLLLAIALPREGGESPYADRVLGVCSRISLRSGLEVGLVRFLALLFALTSLGLALIIYFILHFVLDEQN